jgi:uncharacterized protein
MPDGASKLRDLKQLSDTGAAFEYELELAQLPGVPLHRGASAGTVRARLRFGRQQGWPMAQVALEAEVEMTCQRCMRPMRMRIEADSPVLIVESERAAEDVPPGAETFLAPEGRLSIAALVAEELMLALPIVPMHESGAPCAASGPEAMPLPGASTMPDLRRVGEPEGNGVGEGEGNGVGEGEGNGAAASDGNGAGPPVTRPFADLRAMMALGGKKGGKKQE